MTANKDEMPSSTSSATQSTENSVAQVKKELYVKPAYRMEKVFVTTALSCGKINDGLGHCAGNALQTGSAS
jgi:hypothetical protein